MDDRRWQRITRRSFLVLAGSTIAAVALPGLSSSDDTKGGRRKSMAHELPPLPYAYNALEPYLSEETMHLHHDKHHQAYVNGWNTAEEKVQSMLKAGDYVNAKSAAKDLAFNGSGDILHTIFWTNMKPGGGGDPSGELADAIKKQFGSIEAFKALFLATANSAEGSGWGILAYRKPDDALVILQAEKHENFTQWGVTPILVLDVWEHAYYLQYQNKRPDWTKTFMEHLVNWDNVAERYAASKKA